MSQAFLTRLLTVDLPGLMVLPKRLEIGIPPGLTSVAEAAVGRDAVMRAVASAVLQVMLCKRLSKASGKPCNLLGHPCCGLVAACERSVLVDAVPDHPYLSLQSDALEHALIAALPLGPQSPAGGVTLPDSFKVGHTVRVFDPFAHTHCLVPQPAGLSSVEQIAL